MQLKFTKMHGAGNDFVMLDGFSAPISLSAAQIKIIANRNFGVGCDQLLMVEPSIVADFKYRIFNADGGEVEQCGNGARCFVRFVLAKGLTQKREISVETASGLITLTMRDDNQVTVNMGAPIFEPAKIPFIAEKQLKQYVLQPQGLSPQNIPAEAGYSCLKANNHAGAGLSINVSVLSMGNPHAVTIVDDVETANVAELGPLIESHTSFPQRVNAGFMQILNPHEIKLRVYERGAGETLACGTGACAAVVSGIVLGLLDSPVLVHARGGTLSIAWAGVYLNGKVQPVMMTGAAEIVFEGQIEV